MKFPSLAFPSLRMPSLRMPLQRLPRMPAMLRPGFTAAAPPIRVPMKRNSPFERTAPASGFATT